MDIPEGFSEVKDELEFELFEKEGARVVGKYVGRRTFDNVNGRYECIILETADEKTVAIPCGTKLMNISEKVTIGEYLMIIFIGWQKPKGKRPFKDFKIFRSPSMPKT